MYKSALIGNPVSHSVSPILYGYLAEKNNLAYEHKKILVREDQLLACIQNLKSQNYLGFSVTIPYKEKIIPYIDLLREPANSYKTVNTVSFQKNKIIGDNTDYYGIVQSTLFITKGNKFNKEKAVVFGTGGAARAAIYALRQLGFKEIVVFYRTPISERTKGLISGKFGIKFAKYSNKIVTEEVGGSDMICNMTPTGMLGFDKSLFDLEILNNIDCRGKIFFDAVFNPLETPALLTFLERGALCIDGLWMMIFQGLEAFRIWTEKKTVLSNEELENLHKNLGIAVKSND